LIQVSTTARDRPTKRRAPPLLKTELEGTRLVRQVPIVTLVDDSVGLQAYMRIDTLRASS